MRIRVLLALLTTVITTKTANAQNTIGIPNIINYSKQDYHAGSQNWDIKQDSNGVTYFANNEGLLKEVLADVPGSLVARLKQVAEPEKRAEFAVRSVLSRPARAEEVQTLADYLRRRPDRPAAANQQMLWALFASAEFRFNH